LFRDDLVWKPKRRHKEKVVGPILMSNDEIEKRTMSHHHPNKPAIRCLCAGAHQQAMKKIRSSLLA
jgi:hypothetical protein